MALEKPLRGLDDMTAVDAVRLRPHPSRAAWMGSLLAAFAVLAVWIGLHTPGRAGSSTFPSRERA
jgi:hypothetical protein